MPELPEVETVRMGLAPVFEGFTITHAETRRGDLRIPFPKSLAGRLTGQKVRRLWRRAKYLLGELEGGETLVMHLGMSGRIGVYAEDGQRRLGNYVYAAAPKEAGQGKHDHFVLETNAPARIVFTDHRRFGLVTLVPTEKLEEHKLFSGIGIEPLSTKFDAVFLSKVLKSKKTPIKSALLDQRVVAGLGNIYVCEALFHAKISPKRRASTVAGARSAPVVAAIKAVLKDAIKAGGSSLRDHKRVDGELGEFQHHFAVYDREGERCPRRSCSGTVVRLVQSGRSSFFCPKCQR